MNTTIRDMPKLHSPFVREKNENGDYVVTPVIEDGYEWVFTDNGVAAVEKLHGENASIYIIDGVITRVWNRSLNIPFFNHMHESIIDGVRNAYGKKYMEFMMDGQHFGECIGPKIHGNPYKLDAVLWVPFSRLQNKYYYKSWGQYPKTFDSISEWFEDLPSVYAKSRGNNDLQAEGIVFTAPDGRMAKLRRDMFDWYTGRRHG